MIIHFLKDFNWKIFNILCSQLIVPTNAAEAVQLQVDNLEAASQSKSSSRVTSRIGSRIQSAANSAVASGMHTPRYVTDDILIDFSCNKIVI